MVSKEHNTLVEQIGQLVYKAQCHRSNPNHLAREILSTILAALQEPTEGMCEAGKTARRPGNSVYGNSRGTWRAMLNASLLGEQSE